MKHPEIWYLVLLVRIPFYGGPEEGGWYGEDVNLVAYKQYNSKEDAERGLDAVKKLAKQLSDEARTEYGKQCLREMEFLDARGLDADYLPEPDGPEEYSVEICEELPEPIRGCRIYS